MIILEKHNKRTILLIFIAIFSLFVVDSRAGGPTESERYEMNLTINSAPGEKLNIQIEQNLYQFGANQFQYDIYALIEEEWYDQGPKDTLSVNDIETAELYYMPRERVRYSSQLLSPDLVTFEAIAPLVEGKYYLYLLSSSVFLESPISNFDNRLYNKAIVVEPRSDLRAFLVTQIRKLGGAFKLLRVVRVNDYGQAQKMNSDLRLYIKVDGKTPGQTQIKGGLSEAPLTFSWFVRGNESSTDVEFRYLLFPTESDWSPWSGSTSAKFHFLDRGRHTLVVEARVNDGRDFYETSPPARYSFVLTERFVGKSDQYVIYKGDEKTGFTVGGKKIESDLNFEDIYAHSRALLIGVHHFDDNFSFQTFPKKKIEKDLDTLESALIRNGFIVTKLLEDRLSGNQIRSALDEIVNSSQEGDRILIYLSTHGVPDPNNGSEALLAGSDCFLRNPSQGCIPIRDLRYQAERLLQGKKVRQVLLAVDSCFAGLGVIRKSSGFPNYSKLATKNGAFMITAGMSDQTAQIDPELQMSTFTYFLSKGLDGQASIFDKDGVISLSELFLFTQYHVAKHTNSRQIPMLGRFFGDGEMLFKPGASNEK